jgi:hypothetical protein
VIGGEQAGVDLLLGHVGARQLLPAPHLSIREGPPRFLAISPGERPCHVYRSAQCLGDACLGHLGSPSSDLASACQLGRADQIAEHHRQLATFGVQRPRGGGDRLRGCWNPSLVEPGDGIEELAPMSDRGDAKRGQVVGGQPRQHLGINVVGLERLNVILEAQVPQPGRDVHLRRPG